MSKTVIKCFSHFNIPEPLAIYGTTSMSNQSSIFDPSSFLDATTTQESIKRPPLPKDRELQSTLVKIVSRTWTGKKDPTTGGIVVDVTHEFDLNGYPDIKQLLGGLEKVQVIDGIMLDLTEGGSIDYSPGKNGKLRRYRDALGLNIAGQPFSIRMFEGRMIRVKIGHRLVENEPYDEIAAVAKV